MVNPIHTPTIVTDPMTDPKICHRALTCKDAPLHTKIMTDDRFSNIRALTRVHVRARVTRARDSRGTQRNLSSVMILDGGRK